MSKQERRDVTRSLVLPFSQSPVAVAGLFEIQLMIIVFLHMFGLRFECAGVSLCLLRALKVQPSFPSGVAGQIRCWIQVCIPLLLDQICCHQLSGWQPSCCGTSTHQDWHRSASGSCERSGSSGIRIAAQRADPEAEGRKRTTSGLEQLDTYTIITIS